MLNKLQRFTHLLLKFKIESKIIVVRCTRILIIDIDYHQSGAIIGLVAGQW